MSSPFELFERLNLQNAMDPAGHLRTNSGHAAKKILGPGAEPFDVWDVSG